MLTKNKFQKMIFIAFIVSGLFSSGQVSVVVSASPAIWYVAATGDNSNDCATISTPCATINAAIIKAAAGDTIKVAEGIYTKQDYDFKGWIVNINKSITILGGWNTTYTEQKTFSIIDGGYIYTGLASVGPNVTFSRFIVTHAGNGQVGINNLGGNMLLDQVSVIHNNGAGVVNSEATLTMQNTTQVMSSGLLQEPTILYRTAILLHAIQQS